MNKWTKEYQCPGCVNGPNENYECFKEEDEKKNVACKMHYSGTTIFPTGKIFLGMPSGFNRLGMAEKVKINIFKKFEDGWGYDLFNVPVWKHKDKNGNVLVRGISPRINSPFLHIYLENCLDKINCQEITDKDIEGMDY